MSRERWAAVERYFDDLLFPPDPALDAVLADSIAAGLPAINVSAAQGRLLALLARMTGAARILEIGTLVGYSGIWLARALPPDGRLVTLEADPRRAAIAHRSFDRAGVSDRIDLRDRERGLMGTAPPPAARLAPVLVTRDRVIRQVVGLRPFRRPGFNVSVDRALETPHRTAAVIGAGVVGLSTARCLQAHGFRVQFYAADLPPHTTSNVAGGLVGTVLGVRSGRHAAGIR